MDRDPPRVFTVENIFPDHPEALATLLDSFPHVKPNHSVLNLAACANAKEVIAPAPSHTTCTHVNPTHATLSAVDRTTSPYLHFLLLRDVHLLGIISADDHGFLKFHSPPKPHHTAILIAPAPTLYLRNTPVYISDWRHLPQASSPPILEVLQKDIHPLVKPPSCKTPVPALSRNLPISSRTSVSLLATILAKSPVLATHSRAYTFFLEVSSSTHDAALTIVFCDSAVSLWPFLQNGLRVILKNLRLAFMPALTNRPVLRARADALLFPASDPDIIPERPVKRPRLALKKIQSGSVVTYEGLVTRLLPPATLQLDGTIQLHLGEFNVSIAGCLPARAFRPGTRLRASHLVVVVRPMFPPRAFATARTVIDVLYFADVRSSTLLCWGDQWSRLWRRLPLPCIAFAEEIFDAFVTKFRKWFSAGTEADGAQIEDGVVDALLGGEGRVGLVQFVMFLLGLGEYVLNIEKIAVRNVYKEFLQPNRLSPREFVRPCFPSLLQLRDSVSLLWVAFVRLCSDKGFDSSRGVGSLHAVFRDYEVLEKMLCMGGSRAGAHSVDGVALVGVLDGVGDGFGGLHLSDGTDVMDVRCVGGLQPSVLGAMVCICRFCAVVESRIDAGGENEVFMTIVFEGDDVKIVVDGPCVDMQRDNCGGSVNRNRTHGLGDAHSQSLVLRTMTQNASGAASIQIGSASQGMDAAIVDVPLVCMFVEGIVYRSGECVLSGMAIATMACRNDDAWTVVDKLVNRSRIDFDDFDCHRSGFWNCEMHLKGEGFLKMMACFSEWRLFAFSCTELEDVGEPNVVVSDKAWDAYHNGEPFVLSSELHATLPWIENLGNGVYMRFVIYESDDEKDTKDECGISAEGKEYVYVSSAVSRFVKDGMARIEKNIWRLFEWNTESECSEDRTFNISGIVRGRETIIEGEGISRCTKDYLTVVDEAVGLFSMTICFFESHWQLDGVAKGMSVCVMNVVRVGMESGKHRFEFVASVDTSVRILSVDGVGGRAVGLHPDCVCKKGTDVSFQRVCEMVNVAFLDEFMGWGKRGAGLVRFWSVRVEWLRVRLVPALECCDQCAVMEEDVETDGRVVSMDMVVQIDDGSRVALLRCHGFHTCMRLVRASSLERDAVVRLASACGDVELDVAIMTDSAISSRVGHEGLSAASIVVQFLKTPRGLGGWAVVINKAGVRERDSKGGFHKFVTKGFKFGYGRSMPIACLPLADRLLLDCVYVFEERSSAVSLHDTFGNGGQDQRSSPRDDADQPEGGHSTTALAVLRRLVECHR